MVIVLDREQVDELEQAYALPAVPVVEGLEAPATFKKRRQVLALLRNVISPEAALDAIKSLDLTPPVRPENWGVGVNPDAIVGLRISAPYLLRPLTMAQRQVLVEADDLLADESAWIAGCEHRIGKYRRHQFCAIGAVRWAGGHRYKDDLPFSDDAETVLSYLNEFSWQMYQRGTIATVNDHLGYVEVRHVFEVARNYYNVGR